MRALTCLLLATALTLMGCAASQPKIAATPWPQVTLPAISKQETKERIITATASLGATLVEDRENSAKFFMPLSGGDATMVNMFVGSPRSEPPRDYLTFIFTSRRDGTFVLTQFWREVQQYNGSWKRIELQDNSKYYNAFQQMLWDVRDKVAAEGGLTEK